MVRSHSAHIVVVGAGAAGLMAARELGRGGKRVTILEARDRCGGRIFPLPEAQFGYPAEGGAEFVHGEAPITRAMLREARLGLLPLQGTQWTADDGKFSQGRSPDPHADRFHQVLQELKDDLTVADFLKRDFAGPEYSRLRRSIGKTVEGYDAADPERASILALRDEWMNGGPGTQARIAGGYGALIGFLMAECRSEGAVIHLRSVVSAIEATDGGVQVRCANDDVHMCDTVILTVPLPLLKEIMLPPTEREKAAAVAHIGFGNVIKILLRFETRWWADDKRRSLADLAFLLSDAKIPFWWTQFPAEHPVLTGWFGGPKTDAMARLNDQQLIETGLASLADIFGFDPKQLMRNLGAARAINWAHDPFARGAYSYATPDTRDAQSAIANSGGAAVLFSGEALYRGRDMGTVEAALASGLEVARTVLAVH
jgi:monoamine oxidase